MSINRVHRKKNAFSQILNEAAHSKNLGWAAKGILWYLLTKPNGWEVRTKDLINQSADGERIVKSGLKNLEEKGYLIRWCDRTAKGRLEWKSEIFESLEDAKEWAESNSGLLDNAVRLSTGTATAIGVTKEDGDSPCIQKPCMVTPCDGEPCDGEPCDGEPCDGEPCDGKRPVIYITEGAITDLAITEGAITEREEEAIAQKALPELEEKSIQDQPIADQSASLSIKQRDSADDGKISGETVFAAAPIFPPQKNNATANYEKRFASPHKYPELKEAGHADIMIGTGYLDFDPIVVESAVRHLKKHEKPCEVGDAKRFISNRIKQSDWAAIELLKESAAQIANDRKKTEDAIAVSESSFDTSRYCIQSEPPQIDLEEREREAKAGIAKMRASFLEGQKNRAS